MPSGHQPCLGEETDPTLQGFKAASAFSTPWPKSMRCCAAVCRLQYLSIACWLLLLDLRFPGAGQTGKLGDLNAEKAYSAMGVHMQTVAGNEAVVSHLNEKWSTTVTQGHRAVEAFG